MPRSIKEYQATPEVEAVVRHKRKPWEQSARPWIMEVPVISIDHLPEDDQGVLRDLTGRGCTDNMTMLDNGPSYLVRIAYLDELNFMSARALHVFGEFARRGFRYLRLDPDGEVIAELPLFD